MDEYSFFRDLLEIWRQTPDGVKIVLAVAILGYIAFFVCLFFGFRVATRPRPLSSSDDLHVRELVDAQICKIIAEWERSRLAEEQQARMAPSVPSETGWRM